MKNLTLLLIITLLLSGVIGFGQTTSKVHFFNASRIRLKIEKSDDNYLKLKGYSLIETQEDSLRFMSGEAPMSIGIERGKNYYFIVVVYAQTVDVLSRSGIKVEEVSEREFFWTLLLNKHGRKPDDVFLY